MAANASACQVTQDWDSATIKWDNRPNANTLIGTTENKLSDVDTYALWSIYWVTGGYVFKSGQRIGYALCSDSSTNGDYVNLQSHVVDDAFNWTFESAGTVNNRVLLYDTSTGSVINNPLKVIQMGETQSLDDLELTTAFVSPYSIDQSITWSTNSTTISVNSSTGAITGLVGNRTATITAKHIYNGVAYSVSYTIVVSNDHPQATLYAVENAGHDHFSSLATVANNLNTNLGSRLSVNLETGAFTGMECKTDLLGARIFASRSHGSLFAYTTTGTVAATGIVLNDLSGEDRVRLLSNSISGMNSNSAAIVTGDSTTNLGLALFVGCNTAAGDVGENNLPTRVVWQGAQTAVGFLDTIDCATANRWIIAFYDSFLDGNTVQEAVDYAIEEVDYEGNLDTAVVIGDANLTIADLL